MTATATTFVALVAMAATVSVSPHARSVVVDCRAVVSEGPAVRCVAAAVAAAARDLLNADQVDVALPAPMLVAGAFSPATAAQVILTENERPYRAPLREALLALPPPVC